MPFDVVLYSRPGCCLCDRAADLLESLRREFPHELRTINIDEDACLKEKWCCHIPVIYIDGSHRVALRITAERLRRAFTHAAENREISRHT